MKIKPLAIILSPLIAVLVLLSLLFVFKNSNSVNLVQKQFQNILKTPSFPSSMHATALDGLTGQNGPSSQGDYQHIGLQKRLNQISFDLPLHFIKNEGQHDPSVYFTIEGGKYSVFFTQQEVVFAFQQGREGTPRHPAVRLRFLGANPHTYIEGVHPMIGVVNYFRGNNTSQWQTNVPTYEAILYLDLYPGIDLVYQGREGALKSQFILDPGADPGVIQMRYTGLDSVYLDPDGAMHLKSPLGLLVEAAPIIYQEIEGTPVTIDGRYRLLTPTQVTDQGSSKTYQVGFEVGDYDPDLPLIIDPTLIFATYLGGSDNDQGRSIALDRHGNIYVAGMTWSSDFPTAGAFERDYWETRYDGFLTKIISASGVYTYSFSTYLGGESFDAVSDITIDDEGNIYLTGFTHSSNFPLVNELPSLYPIGDNAFVTKIISASGAYTLSFSTYLGGSNHEWGNGIAIDDDGNIYVVGTTYSWNTFPTYNAVQATFGGGLADAFVTQLINAGGVYTYGFSTYLGGGKFDKYDVIDRGLAIAVDQSGSIYVTGKTQSSDFPTHKALDTSLSGLQDAFVTKIIAADGVYTYGYSTYLGGTGSEDAGLDIAVDEHSNAYIIGRTDSSNFLTSNATDPIRGGYRDAFVTKIINSSGVYTYGFSTYLGGSGEEQGYAIDLDANGNIYATGYTNSDDFPTQNPYQTAQGSADVFVTQFIPSVEGYVYGFSTYLGGGDFDFGRDIVTDDKNNLYLSGYTSSSEFPVPNAFDTQLDGYQDAFVAILNPPEITPPTPDTPTPTSTQDPLHSPTPTESSDATVTPTPGNKIFLPIVQSGQ